MTIQPILTTSLMHFFLKGCENVLFELGSGRVELSPVPLDSSSSSYSGGSSISPGGVTERSISSKFGGRDSVAALPCPFCSFFTLVTGVLRGGRRGVEGVALGVSPNAIATARVVPVEMFF